jgi:hypothetical protein
LFYYTSCDLEHFLFFVETIIDLSKNQRIVLKKEGKKTYQIRKKEGNDKDFTSRWLHGTRSSGTKLL